MSHGLPGADDCQMEAIVALEQHKLDTYDALLAACELALESEECVCWDKSECLHCILTAAVKAAKP